MNKEDFLNKLRKNTHVQFDMPAEESSEVQRQCFGMYLVLVLRQCMSFQGRSWFADLRLAPESGEIGQG